MDTDAFRVAVNALADEAESQRRQIEVALRKDAVVPTRPPRAEVLIVAFQGMLPGSPMERFASAARNAAQSDKELASVARLVNAHEELCRTVMELRRIPPGILDAHCEAVIAARGRIEPPGYKLQATPPIYLGDGKCRTDQGIVQLQEAQGVVLQALIELGGAALKGALVERSGVGDAPRVLKSIKEKYPALNPYIRLPHGKGKGGYSTAILRCCS